MFRFRHFVVALTLIVVFVSCSACSKYRQASHKTRVENVLSAIKAEGGTTGDKINNAMFDWDGGQRKYESVSNEGVFDRFTRWCQEKNINRQIANYDIVGTENDPAADSDCSIVTVRIEGTTHRIRVGDEKRMVWVN